MEAPLKQNKTKKSGLRDRLQGACWCDSFALGACQPVRGTGLQGSRGTDFPREVRSRSWHSRVLLTTFQSCMSRRRCRADTRTLPAPALTSHGCRLSASPAAPRAANGGSPELSVGAGAGAGAGGWRGDGGGAPAAGRGALTR